MSDASRLRGALHAIVSALEPPPYGRTWCEKPCCCTGDCIGCLAERAYNIAADALSESIVNPEPEAARRDLYRRWHALWMGIGIAIEQRLRLQQ